MQLIDVRSLKYESQQELWIEQCLVHDSTAWVGTSELYRSWVAWTQEQKVYAGSLNKFSQALGRRSGWPRVRSKSRTLSGFGGWRLKS